MGYQIGILAPAFFPYWGFARKMIPCFCFKSWTWKGLQYLHSGLPPALSVAENNATFSGKSHVLYDMFITFIPATVFITSAVSHPLQMRGGRLVFAAFELEEPHLRIFFFFLCKTDINTGLSSQVNASSSDWSGSRSTAADAE